LFLGRKTAICMKVMSCVVYLYAVGISIIYLVHLMQVKTLINFSRGFERMSYIAFGSTAGIDVTIAAFMTFILRKAKPPKNAQTGNVLNELVLFFIGTASITALCAVLVITIYIIRPSTVLYLAVEFSVPRLYANAILIMFNSKAGLRKKMNETPELRIPSEVIFGDGETEDDNVQESKKRASVY